MRGKLVLLAGSTALTLCLLEVLLRLLPASQVLPLSPSRIPGVGYQIVPGAKVRSGGEALRINRWGWRSNDFPKEKPPGEFRLFVLGDSVAFGQGVGSGIFPELLESRFAQKGPAGLSRSVRVVNTAVPSYSTCQELALLKGFVDGFAPDLILVAYIANDPEGARTPFGLNLETGKIAFHYRAYHWVKQNVRLLRWIIERVSPLITRMRGRTYYAPAADPREKVAYALALHDSKGEFWPRCARCIAGFADYQSRTKTPVVFALFPLLDQLESKELDGLYAQVAKTAADNGLKAFDLRPRFAALKPAELGLLHTDGVHLSAAGHEFAAAALHAWLLERPAFFAQTNP